MNVEGFKCSTASLRFSLRLIRPNAPEDASVRSLVAEPCGRQTPTCFLPRDAGED